MTLTYAAVESSLGRFRDDSTSLGFFSTATTLSESGSLGVWGMSVEDSAGLGLKDGINSGALASSRHSELRGEGSEEIEGRLDV